MSHNYSDKRLIDFLNIANAKMQQAGLFFGHGTDNAWDEAIWMAMHCLNLPYNLNSEEFNKKLTSKNLQKLNELLKQRITTKMPLAYLVRHAWFAGYKFFVNKHVLVPRSPIAELVTNKFKTLATNNKLTNVLDLCCGSGCIGIAIALTLPKTSVDLADLSQPALDVANINIKNYKLSNRVKTIKSDLFNNLSPNKKYDLIVCNPPYVPKSRKAELPKEYQLEPDLALYSGETGLHCVNNILRQVVTYMHQDSILIIEVGEISKKVKKAYPNLPMRWLTFSNGGSGVFVLKGTNWSNSL